MQLLPQGIQPLAIHQFVYFTICHTLFCRFAIKAPDQKAVHHFVILPSDVIKTGKITGQFTDLNGINFINLFYPFIFQQLLFNICQLFPNYTVNYQNPYFMQSLHEIRSFFSWGQFTIHCFTIQG